MQKLSLITTLKSFSHKEIIQFGDFVHSPFFNKNQAAMKLFDYIKKYYPDFNSPKLDKEVVYKELFGETEYSEGFMKTIVHILTELSEKFLLQISLNRKPVVEKLMICDEMNNRKLEKQLSKLLKETEKEIEKVKQTDVSLFHLYQYQYLSIRIDYLEWTKFKNKNFRDYESEQYSQILDSLAIHFFSKTLSIYRAVLARRDQWHVEFDEKLTDFVINYLLNEGKEFTKELKLKMHLYEIMLHREKSDEYFYLLKEILIGDNNEITRNNRFTLNTILQQYCIKRMGEGANNFLQERFELYNVSLEKKFYRLDSQIYFDQLLFGNISLVAIKLNKFDWAENFIYKYGTELPPENGDIILAYSKSRLNFAKKNYSVALDELNSLNTLLNVPLKIAIRNLLLMIYFELGYLELAEDLFESYKKFLMKNKEHFSDDRFDRQINFMKYYSRLLNLKFKPTQNKLDGLILDIKRNPSKIEGDWLLDKALELEK